MPVQYHGDAGLVVIQTRTEESSILSDAVPEMRGSEFGPSKPAPGPCPCGSCKTIDGGVASNVNLIELCTCSFPARSRVRNLMKYLLPFSNAGVADTQTFGVSTALYETFVESHTSFCDVHVVPFHQEPAGETELDAMAISTEEIPAGESRDVPEIVVIGVFTKPSFEGDVTAEVGTPIS
ncbi:MAG: hypothetical protein DDT19_01539 [Syntrophomonadaceae bacterium]|nr:hypothetical protein [Bacillota bacterium]